MKKATFFRVVLLFFFVVSSVFIVDVRGEVITTSIRYVGGDGPGNYSSIQTAVRHATQGDIIFVYNGTYHENLVIGKALSLIGENKNTTIIDGGGNTFVVTLLADNVALSGFTIINSEKKFPYAGIYINSASNTISDSVLADNYYGMNLGYGAHDNLIVNNTIVDNRQCGIYFNHASYNRLIGNVVSSHLVNGFGLYEFSNNNQILNNTFSFNQHTGLNIRESYQNHVFGNTFFQDEVGLHKPSPEYRTVTGDNTFIDAVLSVEEERDAVVFTVVIFYLLVFFVYLVLRKIVL